MEGLIQLQTEQILLTYLLSVSADETAGFAARAAVQKALAGLKIFIEEQKKTAKDDNYIAHLVLAHGKNESTGKSQTNVAT